MSLLLNGIRQLKHKATDLAEDIDALEALLAVDVPSSLNKIRFITEKVLQGLCKQRGVSWGQAEPTLERMIGPLVAADCIPKSITVHVRTIQMNTSPGSHYQESALSEPHVTIAQNALVEFLQWYYKQSSLPARVEECKTPRSHRSFQLGKTVFILTLLFTPFLILAGVVAGAILIYFSFDLLPPKKLGLLIQ
jgi:hypothetical protein